MMHHDELSLDDLLRIHDEKTGIFIAASLVIGAYAASASEEAILQMREFGILLGRAFQIRDDILDVEGDALELGKKVGKDIGKKK
jgi:geranylgeranyl pyrophosphate synthase